MKELRGQSLEDAIDEIQDLSALGSARQLQSVLRVVARAAIEVGDQVKYASDRIDESSRSAEKLTEQLVRLSRALTLATWWIAAGTIVGAIAAVVFGVLAVLRRATM